jgi:mono/diheme cytochrome c family protein
MQLPDNPLQGRALLEEKNCIECHAIGSNAPTIGPALSEGDFRGTFLDLGAALWNHVPGMSVTFERAGLPWPVLSEREATDLIVLLYFTDYLGRPGNPENGRRVFDSGGCVACHALGGGSGNIGPDLAGLRHFASPLYIAQNIWNHGPAMLESMREMNLTPPVFGEGDLADLSAFIRQQATTGPQERLLLSPGNPNQGFRLFASRGCASCHGPRGAGGSGGPDLLQFDLQRSAEAIAGMMWNHSLAMRDAMAARGIGWPEFRDGELADIVAFLYFLPFEDTPGSPERGRQVFTDRSCAECHPSDAGEPRSTQHPGPDLTGSASTVSAASFVAALWNHAPVMKEAILSEGRRWPAITGSDLRDLRAYLAQGSNR